MNMKPFAILLVSVSLLGCVKAPIEGRADPYVPAQIHFADENVRTHTAVGQPKLARDDAGLLHVNIPIRSASNLKIYIDYRATFFDSNGTAINQTGWQSKVLEPNTPDFIQLNSTSPRAADFQVDVKYSQ
jgi:hypothetical protein